MTLVVLLLQSVSAVPFVNNDSQQSIDTKTMAVYSGKSVRVDRRISNKVPSLNRAKLAWSDFESRDNNGSWKAMWDKDTGIPLRIYGSGLSAPDSIASDQKALAHAKQALIDNIALLAPGSQVEDFKLVSNSVHHGVRTLGFQQYHNGIKVHTGQLSFRYKFDRLIAMASEAMPMIEVSNQTLASKHLIETKALDWIKADVDPLAKQISSASELMILPLVGSGKRMNDIEYFTVRSVMIKSNKPIGEWQVFVDANTGIPVTRHQRLMFGSFSGQAVYNTPVRWPGGIYADYPASHANLVVNDTNTTTDVMGQFTWDGSSAASVDTTMTGPFVSVTSEAGPSASSNFQINDAGIFTWSDSSTEFVDAQITAFVHANLIKEYVRPWNPNLNWLDQVIPVTVNIDDSCNAVSNGNAIFFYRQGGGCNNTARLTDVVYHEFGHSFHQQSIIPGVGAYEGGMGEGVGDFLSATVTNDPSLAPGFSLNGDSLREIDPVGTERVYPDDLNGSVHNNGLIYSGTFWDLRKALIVELGQEEGVALTERFFYATLQRAVDMPSSFVEVLVEDDDDGDLSNGTPNFCFIEEIFQTHGLTGNIENPLFGKINVDDFEVSVSSEDAFGCGNSVSEMNLEWQNKDDTNQNGSIPMIEENNIYKATIPLDTLGTVVQYRVVVSYSNGGSDAQPNNRADPWYEKFNGVGQIISCTNFDTDPADAGWTHSLVSGTVQDGADDWEWAVPNGTGANNDPTEAYTGTFVYGNDLGADGFNGLYQSDIVNETTGPMIDVRGYQVVRLQYQRWLNVEDGIYDQASIYANDTLVWTNFASDNNGSGDVQHQDREWTFRDVNLSSAIVDNVVQLRFELASDGGLEFGGWTLDDVCIVGYNEVPFTDLIFNSSFEAAND